MQRAFIAVAVTLLIVITLSTLQAGTQDWPQWRGPNRDAKTTGFKVPASWPASLTKKWSGKVGNGVATPALVDGKADHQERRFQ